MLFLQFVVEFIIWRPQEKAETENSKIIFFFVNDVVVFIVGRGEGNQKEEKGRSEKLKQQGGSKK